jgi:menaquinone-9 beta-reductase
VKRKLTIIGGGLAGLSLGIALRRRDVPVRIAEASNYPRHRVCGEFISGIADEDLDALGIRAHFSGACRHRTTGWFDGGRLLLRRELPAPAFGISRHFLDRALANEFTALGGELHCQTREDRAGEGIVSAIGRARGESPWIGLKAHYEGLPLSADLEVHLQNGGYVGLTRVENGRVNVCGLFHRPPARDPQRNALEGAVRKAGLPQLAERLHAARIIPDSLKGVSHFSFGWQRESDESGVRIGDRAAMIPPFTGNGMAMAFQSALAAVEPLARWSDGEKWSEMANEIREGSRRLFSSRLAWAYALQSVLMRRWGRRIARLLLSLRLVRFETLYHRVR